MFTSFRTADDRPFHPRPCYPASPAPPSCSSRSRLGSLPGATPGPTKANFVYGPLHRFFGLYFLLSFVLALYTLWKTTRAASGLRKLQLRYLLLGILLGGSGAITTNLLIPLFAGTSRYSALGPYFSLLVVSFSAHAIIRYRLMDIRVVFRTGCRLRLRDRRRRLRLHTFRRTAEARHRLRQETAFPLPQAVLVAIILAIFFQPLKAWLQRSLNRYVYRETYDYQRTIRDASRRLSTILDLDPLLDYLTHVVEETFKTESVVAYLQAPDSQSSHPSCRALPTLGTAIYRPRLAGHFALSHFPPAPTTHPRARGNHS